MNMFYDEIFPLTVVSDRYGGTYSGGNYTAWNLYPDEIPLEINGDDVTCHDFWLNIHNAYGTEKHTLCGVGDTMASAAHDLKRRLMEGRRR